MLTVTLSKSKKTSKTHKKFALSVSMGKTFLNFLKFLILLAAWLLVGDAGMM